MPVSSLRVPPVIRIIGYAIFTVILFLYGNLTLYVFLLCALCLAVPLVPFRTITSGWVPISLFLFFTFVSNLIGQPGKIVYALGILIITDEGLRIAVLRTMRILLMIGGVKIFIASARTEDIIAAVGTILYPLERVGLPVRDFFHIMGLTVTCFPMLKKTATELYRDHNRVPASNSLEKARMLSSFLIPFFLKSLRSPEIFFQQGQGGNE